MGTGFFLALTVWDFNFSTGKAILSLIAYGIDLFYTISVAQQENQDQEDIAKKSSQENEPKKYFLPKMSSCSFSVQLDYA